MSETFVNISKNSLHYVCRICLEAKGIRKMCYEEINWYQNMSNASSLLSPNELWVCWVCGHLLTKYMRFLHQCQKAHYLLTQLAQDPKPYLSVNDKVHNFIHTKPITNSIPPTVIDLYTCNIDVKLENCDAELDSNNFVNGDDEGVVSDDDSPLNIIKDEVDIGEIDIGTVTVTQTGGQTDKPQSAPREGFSSLMRQETEECRIIKLTATEPEGDEEPEDETVVAPPPKPSANNNNEYMWLECSEAIFEKTKEEYRCYTCDKVFPDRQELEQHLIRHVSLPSIVIPKLPLPPSGDDRSDESPATANKTRQRIHISQRNHLPSKTHDRRWLCAVCNAVFPKWINVKKHVKEYHKPPIQCTECFIFYPDYSQFKQHVRDGCRRRFKCKFCDKSFSRFYTAEFHESSVHTKKNVYTCEVCQTQFVCKQYLKGHIERVHEKIRRFSCNICGKNFMDKRVLIRHFVSHEGIEKKQCPYCPKWYYDLSCLKRHMEIHNAGLHTCDICGKSYAHREDLNCHVNIHINLFAVRKRNRYIGGIHDSKDNGLADKVKSTICKENLINLESHQVIDEVGPHACKYCPQTFLKLSRLNRHIKEVHPNRRAHRHRCDLCGKGFTRSEHLKLHVKKIHF